MSDIQKGKLTDEELTSILRKEEQAAANWQSSELAGVRSKALNYYDRKPIGDEEEGRSSIITSEFADTVESAMPGLMRVFASGEDVAEFTPDKPEDEQAAKEASQYVPHVLMRENDGYRVLYWFFKDALMSRLGALMVDVDEVEKRETRPVEAWSAEQLALADTAARAAGVTDVIVETEPDEGGLTHTGTVTYTRTRKVVMVDNIAPEDFLFTPNIRDIDKASFAGYRKQVTASDLRVLGMSKEEVDALAADTRPSMEEDQRQDGQPISERKDSERRMWLVVAYVKADDDGDGISEMLRVVYAHAGGQAAKIIERMQWEDPDAPLTPGTPILMPHTMVGRSLFDQTQDLQDVGTVLTRGLLDNIYMTNRPRPAINKRVSVTSVIDWVPGMPIIVDGNENPAASVSWLQVPSIIAPALTALEHFDGVRENRTGITRYNQGLDADTLNKTASGLNNIMSAAQQRQELTARTFAATAITRLMRHIYRAIKRSATGPIKYYSKGDWAECDPTKWPDDMNLTVAVGTGTGNKQQEMQNLMLVGAAQEKLVAAQGGTSGPIVTPEHMANTGRKLVEAAGFRATGQFIASPKEIKAAPPQPPRPDPEMAKVEAQHTAAMAQQQSDFALAQQKQQNDAILKKMDNDAQIKLAREKAAVELELMRDRNLAELNHKREMMALDARLKVQELMAETALGKYEIDNAPDPQPGAASLKEQQVVSQ